MTLPRHGRKWSCLDIVLFRQCYMRLHATNLWPASCERWRSVLPWKEHWGEGSAALHSFWSVLLLSPVAFDWELLSQCSCCCCFCYLVYWIYVTFHLRFVRHFLWHLCFRAKLPRCHSSGAAFLWITMLSRGSNTYGSQQAVSLFVHMSCFAGKTGLHWNETSHRWPFVDGKITHCPQSVKFSLCMQTTSGFIVA